MSTQGLVLYVHAEKPTAIQRGDEVHVNTKKKTVELWRGATQVQFVEPDQSRLNRVPLPEWANSPEQFAATLSNIARDMSLERMEPNDGDNPYVTRYRWE